ncbi:hypothetical protein [Cumulibacter manganitolerans]|uniref:hypothetical protein n=1 Tax=Cumulibacter manganitolerans TaxID=1884992 RepID=UPI001297AC8B|nr:hypothetical protein [Cumulibacter manganitolerans]
MVTRPPRIVAGYRGVEYDAAVYLGAEQRLVSLRSDRPVEGFLEAGDHFVREVPLAECASLQYRRPVGRYRNLLVALLDETDHELYVESLAHDAPAAAAADLERVERGVYRGWVPAAEVQHRQEQVIDLDPRAGTR